MVSSQILEIILRAKDEMSKQLEKVDNELKKIKTTSQSTNNSIKQSTTSTNQALQKQTTLTQKVATQYDKLKGTVNNAFNQIKNIIKNSVNIQVPENKITAPFMNAAEKIRSKWQTTMQQIKSETAKLNKTKGYINIDVKSNIGTVTIKEVGNLQQKLNTLKATASVVASSTKNSFNNMGNGIKTTASSTTTKWKQSFDSMKLHASTSLSKIRQEAVKLESQRIKLKVDNGEIDATKTKLSTLERTLINLRVTSDVTRNSIKNGFNSIATSISGRASSSISTFKSKLESLKTSASNTFTSIKGHISNFSSRLNSASSKIAGVSSGLSSFAGNIMWAFGQVGVTSLYDFTIGAALAREKLMAVTTSITGSAAATKELKTAISDATSGGVVGFTAVAKAVNTIGLKYNLTNDQLKQTPPLLNTIGTFAIAMGKDGETAATWMSKAYDGLNGNFLVLQRQLGITKQMLLDQGWNGTAQDVDGYTQALQKCLETKPEMQEYLNSFEGKLTLLKMRVAGVGRKIGEEVVPILHKLLDTLQLLEQKFPGFTEALVKIGMAILLLSSISAVLMPIIEVTTAMHGLYTLIRDSETVAKLGIAFSKFSGVLSKCTGVTKLTTAAQLLLDAALSANPVGIAIMAIVGLIAILTALYMTNEDVRNSVNWAFGELKNAFGEIASYCTPIINDLVNMLKGPLSAAFSFIVKLLSSFVIYKIKQIVVSFQLMYIVGKALIQGVLWVLGEAFKILTGDMSGVSEILGAIGGAFGMLWDIISGGVNTAIQWLISFVTYLGETFLTGITTAWQFISDCFNNFFMTIGTIFANIMITVINWGVSFVTNIITTASNAVTGFITWISQLPGQVWTWLTTALTNLINWGISFVNRALTIGRQFFNNLINRIKAIPSSVMTYLNNVITKVKAWAIRFVQLAGETAGKYVRKFQGMIQQLPGIMWNELMNIKRKIQDSVGQLVDAIKRLGENMLNKFKDALGIHSPGYMYHAIEGEMKYLNNELLDNRNTLSTATEKLGNSMIHGFNKNNYNDMAYTFNKAMDGLNVTAPTIAPDPKELQNLTAVQNATLTTTQNTEGMPNLASSLTIPTEQITNDTTLVTNAITQMATLVNPQLTNISTSINTLAMTSTNSANTIVASNQKIIQNYQNMQTLVSQILNNIINKNKQGWLNVKTTTQNNLNEIFKSTKNVTAKMVDAWNSMKTSIINAAQQIKTQSETRFNNLWSTISRFYSRIRNPGGAGSPTASRGGRTSRRSIGSVVRNSINSLNENRRVKVNPINLRSIATPSEISYMSNQKGSKLINTNDVLRYFSERGAGWSSIVSPNTRFIRDQSNKWSVNGPLVFGKYKTGDNLFKVKEFENGTPTISYDTFRRMAENVFSQCHYEFYWDSERYGNWVAAAKNGGMNCSDSTDFLIALAHACGLPASKVHGHWNSFGHYWATVAGHKMDTTGWMNCRNWTPAQSHAGPAPRYAWKSNDNSNTSNDNVNHSGSVDINLNLNINGGSNIDKDSITEVVREAITNKKVLRSIARSNEFQEADTNVKLKLNKKSLRFG